ncbi:MAG: T9SS type A sorting domain-containing protein [Chitinophagaceae bacterium]
MKKLNIFLFLFFLSFLSFGQAPRIEWQRCLGGSNSEEISYYGFPYSSFQNSLAVTKDNRYILGCQSNSADGDISGNHGGVDIWLTCLDQYGNSLWKKAYGGGADDIIGGVQETQDHGFVLLGTTDSDDGDVSGNHGGTDIWVVRLDASGNILWQKCLGGTGYDYGFQIKITPDKGYIIAGATNSNNGDVAGFHPGVDSYLTDAWIIKLDSSGTIEWQKCLGGTDNEFGASIIPTNDGGYLAGNITLSNDGDLSASCKTGNWLVKLDREGIVLWQKCYEGQGSPFLSNIIQTSDLGFIIVGAFYKEELNNYESYYDAQIIKLDSNAAIVWEKVIGDLVHDEFFTDVEQLPDSSYIVSGVKAKSPQGIENPSDISLTKLSPTGQILWENNYGSTDFDYNPTIVKSPEDGYLLTGLTWGNDGDVRGKHHLKTDNTDLWVVKLGSRNTVKGIVYYDKNLNGSKDADEVLITGAFVKSAKTGAAVEYASVSANGLFINTVDTGSYTTSVNYSPYFTPVPASKNSVFSTYNSTDSFSFALQPLPNKRDLVVNVIPLSVARPGFDLAYKIVYQNVGTDTIANGQILFKKDSLIDFVSAIPAQSSVNGDTIKWNYSNLKPFDTTSIIVNMRVQTPPAVNLNDTISSIAIITPVAGDLTPADDTAAVRLIVQGSYDPNDKTENLAGKITTQQVSKVSYINYLVRFQNTGTDTAFNVTIRDTLDAKLDWSSLQMTAASHPYQLNIKSQNQLTWSFSNLKLVDAGRNEKASHGFIAYRVKPKSNLMIGDVIKNTATIYFDYNLPLETNTQQTEVVQYSINNPQAGLPTISSFTPASAASGGTVTIIGTNFTGVTAVSFGSIAAASFTVNSATNITAVVGTGASGNVSVTTAGGTSTLAGFTFIPSPTITSFTPASGGAAASITITGTNLTGATIVSFGGIAATSFTINSATSITAVVGAGASGSVNITTPGGTATLAGFTFTVVTAIDPVPANSLGIRFYPNPTTGSFVIDTLKLADKWETLEIFDTQGKKKLSNFTIRNKTRVTVNVEYLSRGLYMAILKRKNGPATVVKILKL